MGKKFPYAVSHLRPPVDVRWHQREKFPPNMNDDDWLAVVGSKGWVVLSQDRRFHIRDAEIEAIRQHNVKCFYLPGADQKAWFLAKRFTRAFDRFVKICETVPAPFVYELLGNGQIRRVPFALTPATS